MWRVVYSVVMTLALPLLLGRLWWRGWREPLYRRRIGERLGYFVGSPVAGPMIWVHAVSVGEARASAALVRALMAAHPDCGMLLTCTTAAGRETLMELHGEKARITWLPYDTPGSMRRFLGHFAPKLAVLMETEIWPNLIAACGNHGVPVLLANARMSGKSAQSYERWRSLMQPAFAALAVVCAQSEKDGARLRGLGAGRIEITGNVKFDTTPDDEKRDAGRAWRTRLARPVLLLASTRDGEEKLLLNALPSWDERLLVVVVPRHPRRFEEVSAYAQSRRSKSPQPAAGDRIHLGDTMGEMDFYYAAADVAVIGGSFMPLGGQNLIEAMSAGVPVVLGPSMYNFAEVTSLALEAGAAVQAADATQAIGVAVRLLSDSGLRGKIGVAGKALCDAHRGATKKHLLLCEELLRPAPQREVTGRAPG